MKKWFLGYLRKDKFLILCIFVSIIVTCVFANLNPYFSGLVMENLYYSKYESIVWLLVTLLLINIIKSSTKVLYLFFSDVLAMRIQGSIRNEVFEYTLLQKFTFFIDHSNGEIMTRLGSDIDSIRIFFTYGLASITEQILLCFIVVLVMFKTDWRIALFILFMMSMSVIVSKIQIKAVTPIYESINGAFAKISSFVMGNINGIHVVKAQCMEEKEKKKFWIVNKTFRDEEIKEADIWAVFTPLNAFLANFTSFFIYLFGGILVINGNMSISKLIYLTSCLWMVNNPFKYIGNMINSFQCCRTNMNRVFSYIHSGDLVTYTINEDTEIKEAKTLVFENVSFYLDGRKLLEKISFSIKKGQKIGIIGPIGSGKTLITYLLCGFLKKTDGKILINGCEVEKLNEKELRKLIGIVMQEIFLFSDTIKNNLLYAGRGIKESQMLEIAKLVQVDEFVSSLKDGYDTYIGGNGAELSGGQKQRLAIARTLLSDAPIVILDNAFSALDMGTEQIIWNNMKALLKNKICIQTSHRIETIKDADIILYIEDGKIIEYGTHRQLIERQGKYHNLLDLQNINKGI